MVGAGLAGLAAARVLTDAGWDVTVVEARERVGGRIWTVRLDNDEIAEMGAEWVMPGDAELRSWADRYGISLGGRRRRLSPPRGARARRLEPG